MGKRLAGFIIKGFIAILMAMLCAVVPLAALAPSAIVRAQGPVIMLLLLCYLGKLLIDTFFYDHYRP